MHPIWHVLNGVAVGPAISVGGVTSSGPILVSATAGMAADGANGVALLAADGGAYFKVNNGRVLVNSATLEIGSGGTYDNVITRLGANSIGIDSSIARTGSNGQAWTGFQQLTELTTIAAAATTDTTIQMPANSVVLAVSVRVTTIIPTAATFTVGDSGSAARFSTAAVTVAAGSTDPGTKAGAYYNASALSIRITPNLTPAANTGRVRVTIYYYTVTPPTS